MKKIVRLTESDLVRLVKKVIQENEMDSEEKKLPFCLGKTWPEVVAKIKTQKIEGRFVFDSFVEDMRYGMDFLDVKNNKLGINPDGTWDYSVPFGKGAWKGSNSGKWKCEYKPGGGENSFGIRLDKKI